MFAFGDPLQLSRFMTRLDSAFGGIWMALIGMKGSVVTRPFLGTFQFHGTLYSW